MTTTEKIGAAIAKILFALTMGWAIGSMLAWDWDPARWAFVERCAATAVFLFYMLISGQNQKQ